MDDERRRIVVVHRVVLVVYPCCRVPVAGLSSCAPLSCGRPVLLSCGGAHSPLVGVGDGRSPSFVLPRCVLAFVVGRGWWWVLMLALTLVHVAWLCAPIRCWWWVLAPLVSTACGGWWWVLVLALVDVASLRTPVGGGCPDLFVSPCWVLVSTIGGDGAGHLPLCAPCCVLTPVRVALLHGTVVACRRGCVCWWGLVRCV